MPQMAGPSLQQLTSTAPLSSPMPSPMGPERPTPPPRSAIPSRSLLLTTLPLTPLPRQAVSTGADEDNNVDFTAAQLLDGFSDVDNDDNSLTIAGISANNGTLSDDGEGNYSFSPDADFNGEVTLNYVIADPDGGRTLAAPRRSRSHPLMTGRSSMAVSPSPWPTSRRIQSSSLQKRSC